MTTKCLSLLLVLAGLATSALAAAPTSLWEKAYPPADPGTNRYVLHLPALPDESQAKVEMIVGKTVEVDSVNQHWFGGKITEETVPGWGYPRYNVNVGHMAGTRMAAPPGSPRVNKFVTLGGEPFVVRYNSRLPIVVYVPEGFEVRYRLWKAEPVTKPVNKG